MINTALRHDCNSHDRNSKSIPRDPRKAAANLVAHTFRDLGTQLPELVRLLEELHKLHDLLLRGHKMGQGSSCGTRQWGHKIGQGSSGETRQWPSSRNLEPLQNKAMAEQQKSRAIAKQQAQSLSAGCIDHTARSTEMLQGSKHALCQRTGALGWDCWQEIGAKKHHASSPA